MKKAIPMIALFVLTSSIPLWADLIIEESVTNGSGSTPQTATIYVSAGRLAVKQDTSGVIFFSDKQLLWQYDTQRSAYVELTPKDMKELKAKSDALLAQEMDAIKQQMQSMPADQKAQMQKVLDQMQKKDQHSFKRTGPEKSVNGWKCTPVQVLTNGEVQDELCVAALSDLGISSTEVAVFDSLSKFYDNLGGSTGGGAFGYQGLDKFLGFRGFPVEEASPAGANGGGSVVKSIKHDTVPASVFTLPTGLTKTDLFSGP